MLIPCSLGPLPRHGHAARGGHRRRRHGQRHSCAGLVTGRLHTQERQAWRDGVEGDGHRNGQDGGGAAGLALGGRGDGPSLVPLAKQHLLRASQSESSLQRRGVETRNRSLPLAAAVEDPGLVLALDLGHACIAAGTVGIFLR